MPYDVEAIRKKIKQAQAGKFSDPDEFRPAKGKSATEPIVYRCFVLPPFDVGESIGGGPAKKSMENQFYLTHANHWIADKPHPCPRVWDNTPCKICEQGFKLLKDERISKDDDKRKAVVKQWMPTQQYTMNLYFPPMRPNPEDLQDRVMFYNAPKTICDICTAALMHDDAGDPENPRAFGVFYDENNAFLLDIEVLKQGTQNSYKTSRLLAKPRPMAVKEDGTTPDKVKLAKILAARHNLFDKIEIPDAEKINRAFAMMEGDDSHDDNKRGGFDQDETAAAAVTKAPPAGKKDTGTGTQVSAKTATRKQPTEDELAPAAKKADPPKAAKSTDDLDGEAPLVEKPKPSKVDQATTPAVLDLLNQLDDED